MQMSPPTTWLFLAALFLDAKNIATCTKRRPLPVGIPTIATCSTKDDTATYAIDYHINICSNLYWQGFQTKLYALHNFTLRLPPHKVIVFIDTDVFANPTRLSLLRPLFDSFNAKVVVSGEFLCWVGHDCSASDVSHYYGNKFGNEPAPFLNSGGIIGYAGAIRKQLSSISLKNKDDQLAWAEIHRGSPDVVIDTRMRIFGSFASGERLHWLYDLFTNNRRVTCIDHNKAQPLRCKYRNRPGILNSACDWSSETYTPIFWHGNGPFEAVWQSRFNQRNKCLAKL